MAGSWREPTGLRFWRPVDTVDTGPLAKLGFFSAAAKGQSAFHSESGGCVQEKCLWRHPEISTSNSVSSAVARVCSNDPVEKGASI